MVTSYETYPEHFYLTRPRINKSAQASLPKPNASDPCPNQILPCITVAHTCILPHLTLPHPRIYRKPRNSIPSSVIRHLSDRRPITLVATAFNPHPTIARPSTPTEIISTITRPRISNASLTSSLATLRIFLRRCQELRLCAEGAGCAGLRAECGSTWPMEPRRSQVVSDGS